MGNCCFREDTREPLIKPLTTREALGGHVDPLGRLVNSSVIPSSTSYSDRPKGSRDVDSVTDRLSMDWID